MYVKTHMFEDLLPSTSGATGKSAFAARSIEGPKRVVGIGVAPQEDSASLPLSTCEGLLQFYDTNEAFDAISGDPLIQFPMKYTGTYSAATFFILSDSDGYVQFENGITIDSVVLQGTAPGASPLTNCCANIFYV